MEHSALYRKYRPENLAELIGQEHIALAIEGALKNNKIAHAYLFSGSRGTGKTTTARIMAKVLGSSANDTYEIDAASNNGVDDVRELRENVGTLPFDSKYKVYIIDEVHMLSKAAFNALLKTLEEPPSHVVFILATTEVEKVPETIVSRCQCFVFKKPSEAILRTFIEKTAKSEKVSLGAGASELIAVLAEGGFRDALGILQKVISASGNKISEEDVAKITGAPSSILVRDFIEAIARGALSESLEVLNKAKEINISMKTMLELVLYSLRRILLIKVAPAIAKTELEGLSKEEQEFIQRIAHMNSSQMTSKTLLSFLDAVNQQRYAVIDSLPLELALIKVLAQE